MDEFKENVSTLAKMSGLHRDTVRSRLASAGVTPVGKRANAPLYRLHEAMQAIFGQQVINGHSTDPDALDPKSRLDWFKSETERLKFQQETRELVQAHEVRDEIAEVMKAVVGFFESLPDAMERTRLFTPVQLDELTSACDGFRSTLYSQLVDISD